MQNLTQGRREERGRGRKALRHSNIFMKQYDFVFSIWPEQENILLLLVRENFWFVQEEFFTGSDLFDILK